MKAIYSKLESDKIIVSIQNKLILFYIFLSLIDVMSIITYFYLDKSLSINQIFSHFMLVKLSLLLISLILIFIKKSKVSIHIIIILFFSSSLIIAENSPINNRYSHLLWVTAFLIVEKFQIIKHQSIIKLLGPFLFVIFFVKAFSPMADKIGIEKTLFVFTASLIFIVPIFFTNNIKSIFRQLNELEELKSKKEDLEASIQERTIKLNKLEAQIKKYTNIIKTFDLSTYHITSTEMIVIRLMVEENASNKGIGSKLGIKESTVKQHVYNIYQKIGVSNRRELIELCRYNFKNFD